MQRWSIREEEPTKTCCPEETGVLIEDKGRNEGR